MHGLISWVPVNNNSKEACGDQTYGHLALKSLDSKFFLSPPSDTVPAKVSLGVQDAMLSPASTANRPYSRQIISLQCMDNLIELGSQFRCYKTSIQSGSSVLCFPDSSFVNKSS